MSLTHHSYALSLPPDMDWGAIVDGNWTGLMGMLVRNASFRNISLNLYFLLIKSAVVQRVAYLQEADMIAAPFASSVEREQVVDFTESYFLEYTSILVRYLDLGADKWRLYLKV